MNEKREESFVKWIQAIRNDVGMAQRKRKKKIFKFIIMWAMSWWLHISYTINATAPQFQHSTQIQKRPSWSNHIQHLLWVPSVRLPACRPVLRFVRAFLFLLKIICHFFWTSRNDIWSENMRFHFLTVTLSRVAIFHVLRTAVGTPTTRQNYALIYFQLFVDVVGAACFGRTI